jgi:hypothetical protein
MQRRAITLSLLSITLILLALPGGAATVESGADDWLRQELGLNSFQASGQGRPALVRDADGGFLAAWESRRQQSGRYGVYARRLDAWGQLRGEELPVNLNTSSHRRHPTLAAGREGSWLLWEAWGQDGEAGGIVGRRAGAGEILLNEQRAGSQESPVGLSLADGRFLAVWTTPGDTAGSRQVAGRLLELDGRFAGPEFLIDGTDGVIDRQPVLAPTPDGGFRVAWQREFMDAETWRSQVLLRRFNGEGDPSSSPRIVAESAIEPALCALPGEALAIAWLEFEGGNWRVRLNRLADEAADGTLFSPGLALPGWQNGVALSANEHGRLAVAWNQLSADGEDSDVMARLYAADGNASGEPFRVNGHTEGRQALAVASGAERIVLTEEGRLAVAWEGDAGQGDGSAANLTLLTPRPDGRLAELWLRSRMALARLLHPIGRKGDFASGAAAPHQPPVFDATALQHPDPEPFWPGGGGRDEGWQAISNTGWTPPDPHMAVSADHVMAMTNGGIAAYDKAGNELWFDDISDSGGFWGGQGAGSFVFDPEIVFDPTAERFIAMACERTSGQSYFDLAISASADPTGAWHKYRLNVTSLAGNDIDSPNLAVDDQAIYLTADFFGPDKYLVYIIDKASVLGGGAPVTTHVLHTGSQSFGIPVQYGGSGPMLMLEAMETTSANTVKIWAIQDPLGFPNLVSTTLSVPSYWDPPNARSLGTSSTITTFEARFWSCVQRGGSLWACHHIAPTSARSSVASRWYEIELNGWPTSGMPSLRQSGNVQPGGTGYATFNAITVNAAGDAAMVFAYSSTSEYLSMQRASRLAGAPLGTMGAPVLVKSSTGSYSGSRWGDYSAAAVDPAGYEFWMIHEYAISGSWSTWVSHFTEDLTGLPDFALGDEGPGEAWPNPTQAGTHLRFSLRASANEVNLEIFDVTGRRVRLLRRGALDEGEQLMDWDGRDEAGVRLAAGQYLTRLNIDGKRQAGPKITLLK